MAENDQTVLIIGAGVGFYLLATGKLGNLFGGTGGASPPPPLRGMPPAAPVTKASGVREKFDAINEGGCTYAARKVGVGAGAAATGCSAFLKYATPIGWAETAWDNRGKVWDGAKWGGGKIADAAGGVWNNTLGNFGGPSLTPEQRAATAKISKPLGFR